eukprot:506213-Amphidinium_carterae.1
MVHSDRRGLMLGMHSFAKNQPSKRSCCWIKPLDRSQRAVAIPPRQHGKQAKDPIYGLPPPSVNALHYPEYGKDVLDAVLPPSTQMLPPAGTAAAPHLGTFQS